MCSKLIMSYCMAMLKFNPWDMNTQYFMFNSYKAWGALRKAWRGYAIAKNKHEYDNMEYYAAVIKRLRRELGLGISSLPGIGLSKSHLSTKDRNNTRGTTRRE